MIRIQDEPILAETLLTTVMSRQAGAVVLFLGNTREFTGERHTTFLSYECYQEMAVAKLEELRQQALANWRVNEVAIVHRIGRVDPGETSVAIAVASEHREASFAAGKWLIDTLKESVPIWKKEEWADGSSEWVHPEKGD